MKYYEEVNDQIFLTVLIEEVTAVNNLKEILTVNDIDVFFVGPGDLSQELGHIGEQNHPEVQKVVQDTITKIIAKGRTAGTVASLSNYEWAMKTGARFFLSGALDWIYDGFTELNQTLEQL